MRAFLWRSYNLAVLSTMQSGWMENCQKFVVSAPQNGCYQAADSLYGVSSSLEAEYIICLGKYWHYILKSSIERLTNEDEIHHEFRSREL